MCINKASYHHLSVSSHHILSCRYLRSFYLSTLLYSTLLSLHAISTYFYLQSFSYFCHTSHIISVIFYFIFFYPNQSPFTHSFSNLTSYIVFLFPSLFLSDFLACISYIFITSPNDQFLLFKNVACLYCKECSLKMSI